MKHLKKSLAAALAILLLAGCSAPAQNASPAPAPSSPEQSATLETLSFPEKALDADFGYVDFSSDRSTIFFNTTGSYDQTVFFDFFYPFDTSLKLNHYDALTKYQLEYPTYQENAVLMVALDDVVKLYAPYLTYGISGQEMTVRHSLVTKTVHPEDSGLRSPRLNYVKTIWEAKYPLGTAGDITVNKTTYKPFTTKAADGAVEGLAAAEAEKTEPVSGKKLTTPITMKDGKIYVPMAEFMGALEKTALAEGDYLGIQTTIPDIPHASATNTYTGGEKLGNANMTWADYMNGVLDGSLTSGHFWNSFYMGTETLFTGDTYQGDDAPTQEMTINRIIPYNVYIPKNYDPSKPSKLNFMLHGGTGNENAPFERESDRGMDIEPIADEHNYIVLSPNSWTRGPQWYRGPARYSFFKAFEMVCKDYNVDLDRVFLSGNSAGGKGTWDLAIRYPEMFVAISPQAPASTMSKIPEEDKVVIAEKIGDMPAMFMHGTADVTIPYYSRFVPWIKNGVEEIMKDACYVVVEEGHHSYAYGSCMEMMYTFFDRQLEGEKAANHSFTSMKFVPGSSEVQLDGTAYPIKHPAEVKNGVTMVALSDLAELCGPDFYRYNISAYNTDPEKKADVITVLYKNTTVNIILDAKEYRLNTELYERDIPADKTDAVYVDESPVSGYLSPDRSWTVAPYESNGEVFVPVTELMALFDVTVMA